MILDYDLKPEDIQSLNGRESLASFFSTLGYNTNNRIKQSAQNLGITAENVTREIKHIEQIASQDGLLYIYLFELESVTVVLTNALARAFRNKQGNYLLVLTSDYERIDFVFVERLSKSGKDTKIISEQQATVRPRILTIDRRKPNRRQLRVLRRFTYTESDPFAQYDKLLSAYSIFDWSEDHFNNRTLFADYYLEERLREKDEWKEDFKLLYSSIQELFIQSAHTWAGKPEAELRDQLFEPIFNILGFTFKQGKSPTNDALKPDYFLYGKQGREAIALCLCYSWARSLDGKDDQRDLDTPDENPSAAVVSILKDSPAPWAMVTNGKLWRLYHGRTSSIATSFYEIDLEEILAEPSKLGSTSDSFDLSDSFRYFVLFFRSQAFEPKKELIAGEEQTTIFLDQLAKGSEEYAKKLGERLKDRVFEEIFPCFAEGFIEFIKKRDGQKADLSQEKLDEVFRGTLTFLYRLLFLLYAESRDLFPVKETRGYYEKSLTKLKQEIAEHAGDIDDEVEEKIKKTYTITGTDLYDRMLDLFKTIDQGNPAVNVPMYNGGLFLSNPPKDDDSSDSRLARFLLNTKIPDRYLALGIDRLARDIDDKTHALVFIDYKSLGVRQLGSIYEGLLEFKLRVAHEKMAVVKGKKTEEVVTYREAVKNELKILTERRDGEKNERIIPKGKLYLENDKRERKATGSYYTPDYIVKYIVENTVGPVLKEKFEKLTPEFRKAQAEYRKVLENNKILTTPQRGWKDPKQVASWPQNRTLVEKFFFIRVLDPAMGSGHFLVEAADFIADKMIDFLNGFPWNPVHGSLEETRTTILAEMEKQGVNIDPKRLDPNNLIRRYVLKRCVYGVDLNPMAVELAKVSLWLNCFTLGAPLSFLDHHLKCGNSLIGATVDEVREKLQSGQLMLGGTEFTGLMLATDLMRHVGELSDVTAQQVKESWLEFHKATDALAPFQRILDVYTSRWFGNDVRIVGAGKKRREVDPAIEFLQSPESSSWLKNPCAAKLSSEWKQVATTALQSTINNNFFHWELEFPEIFYEKGRKKENGGFDAIVGNPPYANADTMEEGEHVAIRSRYQEIFNRQNDVSYYFICLGTNLLKNSCHLSYIVARYFLEAKNAIKLRRYLSECFPIVSLVDFGDYQIWPDVNILTIIAKFQKTRSTSSTELLNLIVAKSESEIMHDLETKKPTHVDLPKGNRWIFQEAGSVSLLDKIEGICIRVSSFCTVGQGLTTGRNEIFIVEDKKARNLKLEGELLRPYIKTQDIDRYEIKWRNLYLIELTAEMDIDRFPNTKSYLRQYESELKKRYEVSQGQGKWWSISVPRNFKLFQQSMKLLTPLYSTRNRFALDTNDVPYVALTDIYAIYCDQGYSPSFLLSIMNSSLLDNLRQSYSKRKRGGYWEFSRQTLDDLPIRHIYFTTQKKERGELLKQAKKRYEPYHIENNILHVVKYIEQLLPKDKQGNFLAFKEDATGSEEKSDVVHDFLAFLAEEMIRLNKEKQTELKRYLTWLKKKARMTEGIDSLSGKTTITNYLGDYQKNESEAPFEEILKVLQKNRNKIGMNLNQASFISELKREYEASLAKLIPIKKTLAATDKLIDQVVYKLYGLTEEEIKIVEGEDHH
ncbi:MAG: TaqI-like C-terminal specificity domain-containing protein [Bacteroidota bacterium]